MGADLRRALRARHIPLPQNLDQAIRAIQDSDLVTETLGRYVFEVFPARRRMSRMICPARSRCRGERLVSVGGEGQVDVQDFEI